MVEFEGGPFCLLPLPGWPLDMLLLWFVLLSVCLFICFSVLFVFRCFCGACLSFIIFYDFLSFFLFLEDYVLYFVFFVFSPPFPFSVDLNPTIIAAHRLYKDCSFWCHCCCHWCFLDSFVVLSRRLLFYAYGEHFSCLQ